MLSVVLIVLGGLAIAIGLAADWLGIGGGGGFGTREALAIGAGVALAAVGLVRAPELRARLAATWRAAPPIGLAPCALLGVWGGVLTGLVEAVHQAVAKHVFGRPEAAPDEVLWLVAVCYGALFGGLGVLLGLPWRPWRRLWTLPAVVFVFAGLAAWSQISIFASLDATAAGLLSAGIAWQAARLAAAQPARLLRVSRRTTPWLAAVVAVVAVGLPWWQERAERRHLDGLPAPAAAAPNVLLIVLDTVCANHLGAYRYHRATSPTFDALAEDGVLFEQCVSTAPWTVPAHATMFTGEYSHRLADGWVGQLAPGFPTLAEVLSARGYATGGFVGNTKYCSRYRGLARGFAHYEDYQLDFKGAVLSGNLGRQLMGVGHEGHTVRASRNDAVTVTSRFLRWVDRQERPFFAFLNFFDAHALYLPPPGYDELFGPRAADLEDWGSRRQDITPAQMEGFVRAYDGCIKWIDDHVAKILDHLRTRGELENTLIVVTADHGEHFGEHGLLSHANSLYRPLLHVPLVFVFPGRIGAGIRVPRYVSLRDLGATVLDLLEVRPAAPFPGHSLVPLWDGSAAASAQISPVLSEVAPAGGPQGKPPWWPISRGTGVLKSLNEGGLHFILNGDGAIELYDWSVDAEEQRDVSATEAGKLRAAELRQRLAELLGQH